MKQTRFWFMLAATMIPLHAAAQPEWTDKSPHKSDFITVHGVRLHYLDWGGKGETILFLHALGDTAHIYDLLAPKFTNQYHAIALTRRGHGQSEIPETGYDTATRVEDIRQFLDALKIPRVIVAGHSAAGNEVSLFAITHPDRVIKLVYFDAAFYMDGQLELFKRVPPDLLPAKTDMESLDSARRWEKRVNIGWSDAWEATLRAMYSSDGKTLLNQEKRARALGLMVQNEARPNHTKIKSPALMITVINPYGGIAHRFKNLPEERRNAIDNFLSEARQMKEKELDLFRKAIPTGQVLVLTNADHHCFIDSEGEILREMKVFLSK